MLLLEAHAYFDTLLDLGIPAEVEARVREALATIEVALEHYGVTA